MRKFTVIILVVAGIWFGLMAPANAIDFATWLKFGNAPSTAVIPFWQYYVNDQQHIYSNLCVGSTGQATMEFKYYDVITDEIHMKSFDITKDTGGQQCNGFDAINPTVAADGKNHHGYVIVTIVPKGDTAVYVESHMSMNDANGRQVGGYHIPGAVID